MGQDSEAPNHGCVDRSTLPQMPCRLRTVFDPLVSRRGLVRCRCMSLTFATGRLRLWTVDWGV